MMNNRNYNLPNPEEIFRDPNYNGKAPRINENDMKSFESRRESFAPPQMPQQVPKFEDINNPRTFQIQSLNNDLIAVKNKIIEIEKRIHLLEHPQAPHQMPQPLQLQPPPITYLNQQPMQQPIQQPMQQPMQSQQQQPNYQQGFQPFRTAQPNSFR